MKYVKLFYVYLVKIKDKFGHPAQFSKLENLMW